MLLFKLYSLNQTRKAWQENPSDEMASTLKSAILGYVTTGFFVAILFFILLGILSFTPLLGGPYLLAQILFFLGVLPFATGIFLLLRLFRFISRLSREADPRTRTHTPHASNSRVIDVEPEN